MKPGRLGTYPRRPANSPAVLAGSTAGGAEHERGMSLVEALIVVAIIASLTAMAAPHYLKAEEESRVEAAIADIRMIENLILAYAADTGELPNSLAEVGADHFLDPWGNSYEYLRIEGAGNQGKGKRRKDHFLVPVNSDFDLYSKGPDGKSSPPFTAQASRDDIVRTSDGAYVGPVSGY
ncbi:MAG: prepilin-type N-terminal cleavage/methylation domain-containing protein [bacterium]|nr:prepilin-type N-terminal cleavage/methylation domain-containing protein [bacterium]